MREFTIGFGLGVLFMGFMNRARNSLKPFPFARQDKSDFLGQQRRE